MAHCIYHFGSQTLGFSVAAHILFPEPHIVALKQAEEGLAVLYLLHGLHGSCADWHAMTSVERYLYESEKPLCIVIPEVSNNFYTDQYLGWNYLTYIGEELPKVVSRFVRVSPSREKTFVAGLSMGGYGALKLALTYPEKYSYAASFSGALDIVDLTRANAGLLGDAAEYIFGPESQREGGRDDLFALLGQSAESGAPRCDFYVSCGTADDLLSHSQRFTRRARELGYCVRHHEERAMGHAWRFWDMEVEKLIRTLLPV